MHSIIASGPLLNTPIVGYCQCVHHWFYVFRAMDVISVHFGVFETNKNSPRHPITSYRYQMLSFSFITTSANINVTFRNYESLLCR